MAFPAKTNLVAVREAAIALLEEEGETALTLRRLAHNLGLTPNALYRYFSSREVLIASVADEVARRIIAQIDAALTDRDMDPADRVRVLTEVYVAFGNEHPVLYRTLTADRRDAEASLAKPLGHDLLWDRVVEILTPLTGTELATPFAVTLWGLLHGLWTLQQAHLLEDRKPSDLAVFGVETLLSGLHARS